MRLQHASLCPREAIPMHRNLSKWFAALVVAVILVRPKLAGLRLIADFISASGGTGKLRALEFVIEIPQFCLRIILLLCAI